MQRGCFFAECYKRYFDAYKLLITFDKPVTPPALKAE